MTFKGVPKTWTPDRVAELKKLHAQGLSGIEIANALDTSYQAVVNHLRRIGTPLLRKKTYKPVRTDIKRRAVTTQGQDWDQKTTLPYAEWKVWNRNRRREDGKEA